MSQMKRVFSISEDSDTELWRRDGNFSGQLLAKNRTVADAGLCQGEVQIHVNHDKN